MCLCLSFTFALSPIAVKTLHHYADREYISEKHDFLSLHVDAMALFGFSLCMLMQCHDEYIIMMRNDEM